MTLKLTKKSLAVGLLVAATASSALAIPRNNGSDGAFLDQPYRHPRRTIDLTGRSELTARKRSDVEKVIALQTPVKSQAARGTCSIFSAAAYFESLTILQGAVQPDLSEEFLEYVIMTGKTSDGSSSPMNMGAVSRYGLPAEALMPYIGETWSSVNDSPLAQQRCGAVPKTHLKSCLLGHRDPRLLGQPLTTLGQLDPELAKARQDAETFRVRYLSRMSQPQYLFTSDQVKKALLEGAPLLLDLDFFYGTWNHRKASELGINRDLVAWDRGILGYPETGSMDNVASRKEPAGHSIVVVGYDDEIEITTKINMADGSIREFKYKGVYIFKNSWGTGSFGKNFTYRGKTYPGYGMMPQVYGNQYGTFFRTVVR